MSEINGVAPAFDDAEQSSATAAADQSRPPKPAGIADVFLAYVAAMVLGSVAMAIAILALVSVLISRGESSGDVQQWLLGHPATSLVLTNLPFQLAALGVALLWRRDRQGATVRQHLGLVSPSLTPRQWLMLLVAAGVPMAAAMVSASVMPSMSSGNELVAAWSKMGPASAVVWILYIGLAPGICEETLFRGLILRRLLRRWGPVGSIAMSSSLFALAHVDPPAVTLALILGVWQGYLTWRTGSILPAMATHIAINSLWNLAQIVARQSDLSERTMWTAAGVIGVASLVCFAMTVRLLSSRKPVGVTTASQPINDTAELVPGR